MMSRLSKKDFKVRREDFDRWERDGSHLAIYTIRCVLTHHIGMKQEPSQLCVFSDEGNWLLLATHITWSKLTRINMDFSSLFSWVPA